MLKLFLAQRFILSLLLSKIRACRRSDLFRLRWLAVTGKRAEQRKCIRLIAAKRAGASVVAQMNLQL